MKIVQTPVRFYPFTGGVENYVYNLSRELVKLGHDVTVVCANEPAGEKDEVIDGIKIKRLSYIGKVANTNINPRLPFELLREEFDLIHTHLPTPWSADWSAIAATTRRKPLVLTHHNNIVGDGYANCVAQVYNYTGLKFILERANRIIITQPNYLASSSYLEKYEDKVEVIPVGVDAEKFRPMNTENEDNTLFFLSVLDRFHVYKGLDHLLQALNTVKEEDPDVKLIVGGEGELLDRYRQMSSSLGLEENVEFVGFIPDYEITQYYNRCDLFILPSISAEQEGFGMVLLEAMACGKPVISTDIVGVAKDLMENGAGIIVERRDAKGLAEAILHILQNKDRAGTMGAAGRRLVEEKYRWETMAKRVEMVYREMVYQDE